MDVFLQQLINGLSLGGIYALIALGYTMVYGIIELINFAHGDVYTLGTFFSLAILTLLGVTGDRDRAAAHRGRHRHDRGCDAGCAGSSA